MNWNQCVRFDRKTKEDIAAAETMLFNVYRGSNPGKAFEEARAHFGGYYGLIAFLFCCLQMSTGYSIED